MDVVPQAAHDGLVTLAGRIQPDGKWWGRLGCVVVERFGSDDVARNVQSGELRIRTRHRRSRGGQVQVDDEEIRLELRCPRDRLAIGSDDHRVSLEDELVLAPDEVHVRKGTAGFACSARAQLEPSIVLGRLVRRTIDDDQQPGLRGPCCLGRPVLPDVLADGQRDVDATDLDHLRLVAGHEVAELVEDAVVRQVVLVVPRDDPSARQNGGSVRRQVLRQAESLRSRSGERVEVAHDDDEVAEAVILQSNGELVDATTRRFDERSAIRQVLDGVAVDDHLRHRDDVRPALGGGPAGLDDQVGIAGQITERRVHLREGETQLGHGVSLGEIGRSPMGG